MYPFFQVEIFVLKFHRYPFLDLILPQLVFVERLFLILGKTTESSAKI